MKIMHVIISVIIINIINNENKCDHLILFSEIIKHLKFGSEKSNIFAEALK